MKSKRVAVIVFLIVFAIGCFLAFWYRRISSGVLDSGNFQILQTEMIAPNRIAMLAQRSDDVALSGNTVFVVIGDHHYSTLELKRALHKSEPLFIADRAGLVIRWENPSELVIQCKDCGITKDRIEMQKAFDGDVAIRYVGFP